MLLLALQSSDVALSWDTRNLGPHSTSAGWLWAPVSCSLRCASQRGWKSLLVFLPVYTHRHALKVEGDLGDHLV